MRNELTFFSVCCFNIVMSCSKRERKEQEEQEAKRVRQFPHVEGNWPSFAYILRTFKERE